jgi:hypothetical protein
VAHVGTKFSPADAVVFAACELIAIPLCHAGWEAVVTEQHYGRGMVALVVGLPLGVLGAGFHWWKAKISASAREWIQQQVSRWWLAPLLFAVVYAAGPNIYQRAVTFDGTARATGKIIWNFEQTALGGGFFLNMTKVNDQEIRILGFQAHGKNRSNDPISQFSGYLRSVQTNAQVPIYLLAQDAGEGKILACFPHPWIPTLPSETFGIPPITDFDISTYAKPFAEMGTDGITATNFLNAFAPFVIVLEYDGTRVERRFSKEEVNKQIEIFQKSLDPQSNPHILRRANASPAAMPALPPLVQMTPASPASLPPLKLLIQPTSPDVTGQIPSKN